MEKGHCETTVDYKEKYLQAVAERDRLKVQLNFWQTSFNHLVNSKSWRMTAPLRRISLFLIRFKDSIRQAKASSEGAKGFQGLIERLQIFLHVLLTLLVGLFRTLSGKPASASIPDFNKRTLRAQRNTMFPHEHVFSILVPLYNTPKKYLEDMIGSITSQSYPHWELCLADGSDDDQQAVGAYCRRMARKDVRIKYRKLPQNLGISENTNACLVMAEGDWIGLLDHDDILHPYALYECMQAIEYQNADLVYTDEALFDGSPSSIINANYKSDYGPDTLRSYNYFCHFLCFSRKLQKKAGPFDSNFDGSQDFDMVLRLSEKAEHIVHIPKILYFWRAADGSTAQNIGAKPYVAVAGRRALAEHLKRKGLNGVVEDAAYPSTYRIRYDIDGKPKVSILIPSCDHVSTLKNCITSILDRSTYGNFEIIIIENNSTQSETFEYYETLAMDSRIRVVTWTGAFNYPAINNFGFQYASGDYILLLNNDTQVITERWIEEMLMYVQRPDIGAAGAMLYYPTNKIQHAGVILGIGGVAGHSHKGFSRGDYGYMFRLSVAQNLSCVTGACMMVKRTVYEELGGLDEQFAVAFNDVDFCMRIRQKGYLIVWTPFAELYHFESESRGYEDTPEKVERFNREISLFTDRWHRELENGDPYYNPNLTLEQEDFSFR